MNYKTLFISPMIPSFNMEGTVNFFKDILEFKIEMNEKTYAILERDGLTIHVCPAGSDIGEMSFYMEVDNVDSIWNSIKEKVRGLKTKEPFDREYGMREIHIIVPESKTLLFIGQVIKTK